MLILAEPLKIQFLKFGFGVCARACGWGGGLYDFQNLIFLKILTHKKVINMLGFKKNDLNKILKLGQDFTLIKC